MHFCVGLIRDISSQIFRQVFCIPFPLSPTSYFCTCHSCHQHWSILCRKNTECVHLFVNTHTPFNGLWSETTQVGRYQKKHSPTHTHPDRRTSFINFLHLLQSLASSLFSLRAWQSFSQTLSMSSSVFLLVLDPLLHTPFISCCW